MTKEYDVLMSKVYQLDDLQEKVYDIVSRHEMAKLHLDRLVANNEFKTLAVEDLADELAYIALYDEPIKKTETSVVYHIEHCIVDEWHAIVGTVDSNGLVKSIALNNEWFYGNKDTIKNVLNNYSELENEFPDESFLNDLFHVFDLDYYEDFVNEYEELVYELERVYDMLEEAIY